jgi:hypothetical protein
MIPIGQIASLCAGKSESLESSVPLPPDLFFTLKAAGLDHGGSSFVADPRWGEAESSR